MLEFQTFVGGVFDTNSYLVTASEGQILIDAPTGTTDWLDSRSATPTLLLITHGHIDHIEDAAKVKRRFGCPVGYHRDTIPLATDPNFLKRFGFNMEFEPIAYDFLIDETDSASFAGEKFQIILAPGHCPGSLCFYLPEHNLLFGGDVLFRGSIGRTDMPGGDHATLINNIESKLLKLPDATRVLPGHGPETSIGIEKKTNPYL